MGNKKKTKQEDREASKQSTYVHGLDTKTNQNLAKVTGRHRSVYLRQAEQLDCCFGSCVWVCGSAASRSTEAQALSHVNMFVDRMYEAAGHFN